MHSSPRFSREDAVGFANVPAARQTGQAHEPVAVAIPAPSALPASLAIAAVVASALAMAIVLISR